MGAGIFIGVGTGPGGEGLIPVAAWEAVQSARWVYLPRARGAEGSVATLGLPGEIPRERMVEVEFDMALEHASLVERYGAMAEGIVAKLLAGEDVAYLTLGDTSTYSTFNYALKAVKERMPEVRVRVFPGVTSYAALAAESGFSLGEKKERVLILPCPETREEFRVHVLAHHVVVVMKMGPRLGWVLEVLREEGLLEHSYLGSRVGMEGEVLLRGSSIAEHPGGRLGYFSTLLVRNVHLQER
jgi:precorrin-2/cobalt-factor-2 C20-methyltransferase